MRAVHAHARLRAVVALFASFFVSACGYGLHETAKTLPRGAMSFSNGASFVTNSTIAAQQPSGIYSTAIDLGPIRYGFSDQVDMGATLLYGLGGRIDTKYNLMPRERRLAIAPRLGVGMAVEPGEAPRTILVWMGGVIASYDVYPTLTPYLSGTWVNHWIHGGDQPYVQLAPNEYLANRTGTGDGLLQLVAGLEWRATPGVAISLEYGLWLPMQDDPGDNYRFVTTHIVSFAVRFCFPTCQ